ncbi:MAG: hypothetical protein OXG62_08875 [Nitrospinae bacterium]|nr:hypothetical protein [Nitrospinota bacterium]
MDFREQIYQRLMFHIDEIDVSRDTVDAFTSDIVHILDRITQDRIYEASLRQILQRYADEWAEQSSRRILDSHNDEATEIVYEMIDRQARNRAIRALRKVLLDTLQNQNKPLDDLDFFDEIE